MENRKVKAAMVGSRTFMDYKAFKQFVEYTCKDEGLEIVEIISGGARGADKIGAEYGKYKNIPVTEFKADWNKYGKSAGFIRNHDIIKNCDVCFAFWDGESKGTKHDIELCEKYGKTLYLYEFKNEPTIEITHESYREWGEEVTEKKTSMQELGKELYDTIDRCVGKNIKLDIKQL